MLGFQVLTPWQLMQLAEAGMCAADLPDAATPLWQLAHAVPALKLA